MKAWQIASILVLVVVLVTCGTALLLSGGEKPWVSQAPERSEQVIRIASFNVEGLFDPNDDPRLSGRNDDVPSDEAHLDAVAGAVLDMDADVLALQGVESLAAVGWFNDSYLSTLGYDYIASVDVGHTRGIENAVLSRFPISEERVWPMLQLKGTHPANLDGRANPKSGQPIMFRRSPLMVTIEIPRQASLTVFVLEHKGGDRFGYWRNAEAQAIADLCRAIGLSRRIILLGSFHCEPGDPVLDHYFEIGFRDPVGSDGNSEFHATEISGDRTDFILANRAVGHDVDPAAEFVLGGSLADMMRTGEIEMSHLPVVVELQVGDD